MIFLSFPQFHPRVDSTRFDSIQLDSNRNSLSVKCNFCFACVKKREKEREREREKERKKEREKERKREREKERERERERKQKREREDGYLKRSSNDGINLFDISVGGYKD